jgi:hypothetical protein
LASRHLFCEDIPRHLYFFNEKTIRRYLSATGFKLERADYRGNIFAAPPCGWLSFLIKTRIRKQTYGYHDVPLTRPEFLRRKDLKPGLRATVEFALANPLKVVDRAFWPLIEGVEILTRSYPVCTFVSRKL